MILKHDPEADAIYLTLRDVPYLGGHDHWPGGIELLNVSHGVRVERLPGAVEVADLLRAHSIPVVEPAARWTGPRR